VLGKYQEMRKEQSDLPALPTGVFAALPTPCQEDGTPSFERLDPLLDFLMQAGLNGVCIGGATGEYLAYSPEERAAMLRHVVSRADSRLPVIFGAGGEAFRQVISFIKAAVDAGASAVLIPAPAYFRYDADDLIEFITRAASISSLPVLLYLIPQFNGDIGVENALRLVQTVPNVKGVKDSSGLRGSLDALTEAKRRTPLLFFSGSDDLLLDALARGADGAISGAASAIPEVVVGIYRSHASGRTAEARQLQALLNEFIAAIGDFPVPWGIRWAVEARGFSIGPPILPMSKRRQSQRSGFQDWFKSWWSQCSEQCTHALAAQ
jgi:4-hydroxy-tetrahydrodipicolinate synthase